MSPFVGTFMFVHVNRVLKFWRICSRGFGVIGVSAEGCARYPKFSAFHSSETIRPRRTYFGGARTIRMGIYSITMSSMVGLGHRMPPGVAKVRRFLPAALRAAHSAGISVTQRAIIRFLANVNVLRYVCYMLSAVRLSSVCLSVVSDVGAPYSGG